MVRAGGAQCSVLSTGLIGTGNDRCIYLAHTIATPDMWDNANTFLRGMKVALIPYQTEHVARYHGQYTVYIY